jgi:hypothetical protein
MLAAWLASFDVKTTTPLGATAPGLPEITRAVNVTSWLTTAPLLVGKLELRTVLVPVTPTLKGNAAEVDALKFESAL